MTRALTPAPFGNSSSAVWGLVLGLLCFRAQAGEVRFLVSPDNRLQVCIQLPAPGTAERPRWSAAFQGRPLLTNCALGLQTADAGELMAGVRLVRERDRSLNRRIPVLFGKADHADDRFRETRLTFETPGHRRVELTFRCYNDAVAFRYELPKVSACPVSLVKVWSRSGTCTANLTRFSLMFLRTYCRER